MHSHTRIHTHIFAHNIHTNVYTHIHMDTHTNTHTHVLTQYWLLRLSRVASFCHWMTRANIQDILWQKEVCCLICIKQWFYKSKHINPKCLLWVHYKTCHTWELGFYVWEVRKKNIFSSFTKKLIPQSCFLLSWDGSIVCTIWSQAALE